MNPTALTRPFVAGFADAVRGPAGERLAFAVMRRAIGAAALADDDEALARARALGWLEGERFSASGQRAADALREYAFFLERSRHIVPADAHPALRRAFDFAGRRVLEVGAGFGVNGLGGAARARCYVGIDLDIGLMQLSPSLTAREGRAPLRLACAAAEALPFADACFDLVLASAVLQYTVPRAAIAQMARVLAPGGQLVITCGTFRQNLAAHLRGGAWRSPRRALGLARSAANALGLQTIGRRLFAARRRSATSGGAHTSRAHVRRALERAGLTVLEIVATSPFDTLYRAERTNSASRTGAEAAMP